VARSHAANAALTVGRADLVDDVSTLVSELVSNAVLHARTQMLLTVKAAGAGLRVEVADASGLMPRFAGADLRAISGRGLLLIDRLSSRWGVDRLPHGGKVVWVEIEAPSTIEAELPDDVDALLALWVDDPQGMDGVTSSRAIDVSVDIDVNDLVESRHETDSQIRDMQLLNLGTTAGPPTGARSMQLVALARQLDRAFEDFGDGRRQIQSQALAAQRAGQKRTTLHLYLEPSAGPAAQQFLEALEAADRLTAAGVLLVPPSTPTTRQVRRYYVKSIIEQLHVATGGDITQA
jgi:anti-sigma regulatory factor (Ser/Thr protein kinase)